MSFQWTFLQTARGVILSVLNGCGALAEDSSLLVTCILWNQVTAEKPD